MTFRVRVLRFTKRLFRIGQPSDGFFSGRGVSTRNSVDAGRAEHEAHSRSMQGL